MKLTIILILTYIASARNNPVKNVEGIYVKYKNSASDGEIYIQSIKDQLPINDEAIVKNNPMDKNIKVEVIEEFETNPEIDDDTVAYETFTRTDTNKLSGKGDLNAKATFSVSTRHMTDIKACATGEDRTDSGECVSIENYSKNDDI